MRPDRSTRNVAVPPQLEGGEGTAARPDVVLRVSAQWLLVLGLLVGVVACRVSEQDVEEWKGTVKGPGKIVAVMLADKYGMELRTDAALALVEMQRQDVNGVQELQRALQKLDGDTRAQIVKRLADGLAKLMNTPDPEAPEDAGPSPTQIRAKDAAYLLIQQADPQTEQQLTKLVVGWYIEDFNGRSLAGNFTAEQVVQELGAPAAAMLVDALDAKMPQQALVKLAELVGQSGDAQTKQRAAERLVEIHDEMQGEGFTKWLKDEIRRQLKESDQEADEERIAKMAALNQHVFLIDGALTAMKHLADQPKVAERLIAQASQSSDNSAVVERRTKALQALEGKARKAHLEPLLKLALDDANPVSVRDYAFDRVGDIRSKAAIPPMWPLVQSSKDARLRWRAGELVLAIGGNEVLAEFFSKLPSGDYSPEELEGYATRMGQMNPLPRQVATAQLRSPSWWDRVIALKFFERKGEKTDVAALQALADDKTPVVGKGWPKGHTVGKVAEAAAAALRKRLAEGSAESTKGSST